MSSVPQRRIWSDPYFYAVLSVIGGSYVILIIVMLLADATHLFTSDMRQQVTLDFSTAADGSVLAAGTAVADQFAKYGLRIRAARPTDVTRIVDSSRPSAANSDLGTPHIDFGGPGIGKGGQVDPSSLSVAMANDTPLGNVLVLSRLQQPEVMKPRRGEVVVEWLAPVQVETVWITGLEQEGGSLTTYDEAGQEIATLALEPSSAEPRRQVPIAQANVTRLVLRVPGDASDVEISFQATDRVQASLGRSERKRLSFGHLRVVPPDVARVTPTPDGGTIVFAWEDPIRLDSVTLLDIDRQGGKLVAYDLDGEVLSTKIVEPRGSNGVQVVDYMRISAQTQRRERGQYGIARLEVQLPCSGAIGGVDFTWSGRVRSAWQRDNPRLARLFYNPMTTALGDSNIRYSIRLSLISCTISAILSLWVSIPIGYLMSRHRFYGRNLLDAILDIPIVLPPLVVGLSLLILFMYVPFSTEFGPIHLWPMKRPLVGRTTLQELVVYQVPAVIIAQFSVACAFAVRTMRATFDQIDARREQVALTLGCSRFQAFGMVVLPEASRGILTAGTLAWARSLGEFGPLLIFAGATRRKTEVLSTTVFLEISIGDLGAAVAVSLIMVLAAVIVLVVARLWGNRGLAV